MGFYQKYRVPILVTTTVLSSIVVAVVIDKLMKRSQKTKIKVKNPDPKNILIVGDSQSAIKTSDGKNISWTYPALLKKHFTDKTIDVMAKVGKPTSWMLENLPAQLKDKKYDRVYIYGGGNDAFNSSQNLDKTMANFQKMVDLVIANGADAYVVLGYKIDGFADYNKMPITPYIKDRKQYIPLIERRKEIQRRLPKEIKNAQFVPIFDLGDRTTDGIHATPAGHKIIAEKMIENIKNN